METTTLLNEILNETGWSQDELARHLGVTAKTLSTWMTGKAMPRAKKTEDISLLHGEIVGRTKISMTELARIEDEALNTGVGLDEFLTSPKMLNTVTLFLTYHTNALEGSAMTLAEVAEALDDENAVILDRSVREQIEVRNHRAALNYLLAELRSKGANFRWTTQLISAVHLRLMNGLIESAGSYRLHGARIPGSPVLVTNHLAVPKRMLGLVEYMNAPYGNPIERMAVTHAMFEQIYPFGDGNGRIGRLVMLAQALRDGLLPPLIIKERKRPYGKYLRAAQMYEDYDLLRMFIAESMLTTRGLLEEG